MSTGKSSNPQILRSNLISPQDSLWIPCAGLENDEYTRKTDGYLPTAEVAFIDEIFKANSAILNALLTLLNERLFDNGNQRLEVPLLCLVSLPALLPIPVYVSCCCLFPFHGMTRQPRGDLGAWRGSLEAQSAPPPGSISGNIKCSMRSHGIVCCLLRIRLCMLTTPCASV